MNISDLTMHAVHAYAKMAFGPLPSARAAKEFSVAIEKVEGKLLQLPQVECQVFHRFAEGIYIREVHLPAGIVAIGHHQKCAVMNVVLTGKVTMLNLDGTTSDVVAPVSMVGQIGRKIGYIHEYSIWQNIYPNPDNERNIEILEARWLDKSPTFLANKNQEKWIKWQQRAGDRVDFGKAISELGFTESDVCRIAFNESDLIPFPESEVGVAILESPIHGKGLFATRSFGVGETICSARVALKRTPAGRFANHSLNPNAEAVITGPGDIALIATKKISGNQAGSAGDEITVDYRSVCKTNLLSLTI